jgi:hypothetical protein
VKDEIKKLSGAMKYWVFAIVAVGLAIGFAFGQGDPNLVESAFMAALRYH